MLYLAKWETENSVLRNPALTIAETLGKIQLVMKNLNFLKYGFPIYLGALILIVIGLLNGSRFIFRIYPTLICISGILVLISIVLNTENDKNVLAVAKFFSFFLFLGIFFLFFLPRDLLFSNVGIDPNITHKTPINNLPKEKLDSLKSTIDDLPYFELTGSLGSYTALFNQNIPKKGSIYLKIYDAVGNIELAPARIPKGTKKWVKTPGQQFLQIPFTQYDGAFLCFFIARIELWLNPIDAENDIKLAEQNFKVDGWIR